MAAHRRPALTFPPAPLADVPHDRPQADRLYRAHAPWLIAFLRRRFGAQEAEDLAQEAYVRLFRHDTKVLNPRAFLARVALNAARDQARRRAVRPALLAEDPAHPPTTPAGQAEAVLLKQAILALPPRLRTVFLLSRFGGLTYEEIARRCNVSVKTVEARMTQALAMCSDLMRD